MAWRVYRISCCPGGIGTSRFNFPDLEHFVQHWIPTFPQKTPTTLTTFLRLSVVGTDSGDRAVLGGRYLGSEDETKAVLAGFLKGQAPWHSAQWSPSPKRETIPESRSADAAQWDAVGRKLRIAAGLSARAGADRRRSSRRAVGDPAPNLSDTCAGVPLRHKISSGFADAAFDLKAIQLVLQVLRQPLQTGSASVHVSFHSLGGAVTTEPEGGTAFAYRDRHFLLQYQAWWLPGEWQLDGKCIAWIEEFPPRHDASPLHQRRVHQFRRRGHRARGVTTGRPTIRSCGS